MSYTECSAYQTQILEDVVSGKITSTLLFAEHHPVLTLGASFHKENLLLSDEQYRSQGIEIQPTDRGGDVTFHGPGQLVIYPIFNLSVFGMDLHKWLRNLEQAMIETLKAVGIEGQRLPPHTGVWISESKVAAIGIKVRRWVSMHGIALNCNNDLSPFEGIIPCGINGYGVTSISKVLGIEYETNRAKPLVLNAFQNVFDIDFRH